LVGKKIEKLKAPKFNSELDEFYSNASNSIQRYCIHDDLWLSKREYFCSKLWLKGYSSSNIATKLNLSPKTVQSYIEKAKIKLNAKSRSEFFYYFTLFLTYIASQCFPGFDG
jgi:DNA-binding CsgD family transcriptional regulator